MTIKARLDRLESRTGHEAVFLVNPWTIGDEPSEQDIQRHQDGLRQALRNPRAQIVVLGDGSRDPFNVRPILEGRV